MHHKSGAEVLISHGDEIPQVWNLHRPPYLFHCILLLPFVVNNPVKIELPQQTQECKEGAMGTCDLVCWSGV